MSALSEYFNLAVGGLFLKSETYEKMREERNPFVKGLIGRIYELGEASGANKASKRPLTKAKRR